MITFAEIAGTALGRLRNVLARVLLDGSTGNDPSAQAIPDAEVWQQYGFASRPAPSAGKVEALVVPIEGGVVVLATRQQRTQVELAEGEVVLFNVATGCTMKLLAAGGVEVRAAAGQDVTVSVHGGTVQLGGTGLTALQGVVNGEALDPFTGMTQAALGNASATVLARKT